MDIRKTVLKIIQFAFERELSINLHNHPFDEGLLTLEGEAQGVNCVLTLE